VEPLVSSLRDEASFLADTKSFAWDLPIPKKGWDPHFLNFLHEELLQTCSNGLVVMCGFFLAKNGLERLRSSPLLLRTHGLQLTTQVLSSTVLK